MILGYHGHAKFVDFIFSCNGTRQSTPISSGSGCLITFAVIEQHINCKNFHGHIHNICIL